MRFIKMLTAAPVVFSLLCWSLRAQAVVQESPLKIGAAKVDITPENLDGFWSVWATAFTGVHDHIFVRALVIENEATTVALVSTDLVEFGDTQTLRQRIQRELGIAADHIMISATHDHNAPRGGPITPGSSSAQGRPYSPPSYVNFVDDKIVAALRMAKASAQPGRIGVGKGSTDINVNRNGFNGTRFGGADPDGPSDKTVWVVRFESLAGKPIALLMNYAVHSVVAGPASTLISGDLAGAAERIVEERYGDQVVALWTMGPAGDQNPKYMRGPNDVDPDGKFTYEAMEAQGMIVALEAMQTADRIRQLDSVGRITAEESVFSCPTVPQKPKPAHAGPPMFPPNPNFKESIPYPTSLDVHLNLIEINQVALAGVSGEIFTRIYWHLEKASPLADTILITMSNGRIGYIADDAEYYGPFGNPSLVQGCAESKIVDGLTSMIKKAQ